MRDPRAAVNVPVNYVFRPTPANWTSAQARVVAWSAIHPKKRQKQDKLFPPPISMPFIDPAFSTLLRLEIKGPGYLPTSFADVERGFVPAGLLPTAATPEKLSRDRIRALPCACGSRAPYC
jgi:hypothetical protein